jgi:hypothetical protein
LALPNVPSWAEGESKDPKAITEQKIAKDLEKVVYVPHDTTAPRVTDVAGVRGVLTAPELLVLAPERLARTLSAEPTLYWYISERTELPVRFTLLADDPTLIDPLLEIELGTYDEPGIHAISLADHGVLLEHDRRYSWSVAISAANDGFSREPVAQTVLEHHISPKISSAVEATSPFDQAVRLAAEGYWYDAIDVVSKRIEAGDRSVSWREIRAHLLNQGGLDQAAGFDHEEVGK